MEVDHPGMWKKGKLYGSAMLLLEELHFMMTCSKLPTKSLVLEQVLERLLLLLLPSFCNVKLTLIVSLVVNCFFFIESVHTFGAGHNLHQFCDGRFVMLSLVCQETNISLIKNGNIKNHFRIQKNRCSIFDLRVHRVFECTEGFHL